MSSILYRTPLHLKQMHVVDPLGKMVADGQAMDVTSGRRPDAFNRALMVGTRRYRRVWQQR